MGECNRIVYIQHKFINGIMHVNDTGGSAANARYRPPAIQDGRRTNESCAAPYVSCTAAIGWTVLRTLITLTAARDVKPRLANATVRIRSVHRARVRCREVCVTRWQRSHAENATTTAKAERSIPNARDDASRARRRALHTRPRSTFETASRRTCRNVYIFGVLGEQRRVKGRESRTRGQGEGGKCVWCDTHTRKERRRTT